MSSLLLWTLRAHLPVFIPARSASYSSQDRNTCARHSKIKKITRFPRWRGERSLQTSKFLYRQQGHTRSGFTSSSLKKSSFHPVWIVSLSACVHVTRKTRSTRIRPRRIRYSASCAREANEADRVCCPRVSTST